MKCSIIVISILLLFAGCGRLNKIGQANNEYSESDYLGWYTEATKQALVNNNFKNAISLYGLCIKYFPEKAAPYYQISNIYAKVNDIDKAKFYALKATERDSVNKWYLAHLANIYRYQQNSDSLEYVYEKLVKLDSTNIENLYNLAMTYSNNAKFEQSNTVLEQLKSKIPGSRELFIMRHRNYNAQNNIDSAIFILEQMINSFPDELDTYGMLAEYLSEVNRYEQADSIYKELLKRNPDNGLANISYGDFLNKLGKKQESKKYYIIGFKGSDIQLSDKLTLLYTYMREPGSVNSDTVFIKSLLDTLKKVYNDYRPYSFAAEFYIKQHKYRQAINELRSAINLGSDMYIVWEQYIMLNNYLGQHSKVSSIVDSAITLFPNEVNLFIYGGHSLYGLGEHERLETIALQGLKINDIRKNDSVQLVNLLADSYRVQQFYTKSDSCYEKILEIDKGNILIRNNYAYYLSIRGEKLERAKALSFTTINQEPNNATYLDTYGWILFKMGNYHEALIYLEKAINNGAYNNSEVLDHYGDVMLKLDRCTEAREAWSMALKYDADNTIIKSKLEVTCID